MGAVKRVAVIGAGPAGAITIDALAQEKTFDVIRVFERREAPGGCWLGETKPPPILQPDELGLLASRAADGPHPSIPSKLPAQLPKSSTPRYAESTVYPYLETNIDFLPMQFSQEPFPQEQSEWSVSIHGADTPFRPWSAVQGYVRSLVERRGYQDFVEYNTTVEKAEKMRDSGEWKLTLRKEGEKTDYWWEETLDAVVVASGHYSVPYIPSISGLAEFARDRPGSVIHSKHFRGRDAYKGKRVVVVGASVSAADIAFDLTSTARAPVYAVTVGHNFNGYFGGEAFNHPQIVNVPSISRIDPQTRTVHFVDGTSVANVDDIIFGTGYTWTLPFLQTSTESESSSPSSTEELKQAPTPRNNRVPDLYLHVVYRPDPTLLFVGAVNAGLTFKIFEWQAVLAARILAGRVNLPPVEQQKRWEEDRVAKRGDGAKFALVFPDFEEYFETVRKLAGPANGKGRELPPFNKYWFERFLMGHERRKDMWRRLNAEAREALSGKSAGDQLRARL
ncbi:dimethylaniline monooxygenase [Colletotrichum truncatum]|uniref:Dimethylaniline monooxygenase n=1 Tax=Colletotrichum truncatum TaxID=5467 RepID=A0ACC3YSL7_COLTU|nr:dimethylaniline monooxygenase [Colletotrichum truncatum]KAF6799168.1 dimethylaniline monooxygenase [Colletotrichum truncatum]